MKTERVMLLIDADNVSVDVMEQALRLVHQQHGAVHVRRAYGTAESAVRHQAAFKRLGIKPMVNLAAGKNSTDIALAVDAMDLVLSERPEVVVIVSSDSDFAPLVQRLREKGCTVRGIGQQGKTGEETLDVYDDYTVLEHRAAAAKPAPAPMPRKTAAKKAPAAKSATGRTAATKTTATKSTAAKTAAAKTPAAKKAPARKTAAKKAAAPAAAEAATVEAPPAPAPASVAAAALPSKPPARTAATAEAVLARLPELAAGQTLALNTAVQRLREAGLLGRNTSSLKLFSQLGEQFELLPAGKPSQVRLKA